MKGFRTLIAAMVIVFSVSNGMAQIITADGPLEFCYGESVTLCVEPAYSSYLWNTGYTGQCVTVLEGGDYYAFVVDSLWNIDSSLVASPTAVTVYNPQPQLGFNGDTLYILNSFESYQWYFIPDWTPIPEATNSFFIPDQHAYCYTVEVTDSFGCVGTPYIIEFGISYSCYASVDEQPESIFNLYPNPTIDLLHVKLNGLKSDDLDLLIVDVVGKVIHQQFLKQVENEIEVDVSDWSNGVYLVSVAGKNGGRHTERVVVQNE